MWSTGRREDRAGSTNWHLILKLTGFSDKSFLEQFFIGDPFSVWFQTRLATSVIGWARFYALSFLRDEVEETLRYKQRSLKCIKNWFFH